MSNPNNGSGGSVVGKVLAGAAVVGASIVAAKLINEKVSEFERNYTVKEKRDVLAMVMLQIVSQQLQEDKNKSEEISKLQGLLDELNRMVKDHQVKVNQ